MTSNQKLLNLTNEFKTGFENSKWNYPNRKWNYISYFLTSNQKTYFTKGLSLLPRILKMVLKTGNGIIQTGNGIISLIFWPKFEKLHLQNVSIFYQQVQNRVLNRKWNHSNSKWNLPLQSKNFFCKKEIELSKQEMELFLLFSEMQSKNIIY